jgi:hypothetical protein
MPRRIACCTALVFILVSSPATADDPFPGKPSVSGTWKTIRAGHQLIYLGGDRVLDWEPKSGHYRIWAYDRTKKDEQNPFPGNPEVEGTWETIRGDRQLVYLGGDRVLDWEPESGRYRIWPYDRKKTGQKEPFPGDPVVEGTWKTIRAGHQLVYLGDDRVLHWKPNGEDGRYRIWRYDRGKTGRSNPLQSVIEFAYPDGTWPTSKKSQRLISLEGKRVLDWEPETGHYRSGSTIQRIPQRTGSRVTPPSKGRGRRSGPATSSSTWAGTGCWTGSRRRAITASGPTTDVESAPDWTICAAFAGLIFQDIWSGD